MAAESPGDLFSGDVPPRSALGWAVFLAASWTWCIGMFLPVILLREFTVWGWLAFTLPNVVGAAAMGWILRSPASSQRIVACHGPMLALFSLVTVAFQAYFAGWMLPKLGAGLVGYVAMACALGGALAAAWRMRQSQGLSLVLAQATYAASIAALVAVVVIASTDPRDAIDLTSLWQSGKAADLVWFTPTFIFGFLLCPYLDLTFHRARQSQDTQRGSHIAFGAGFAGFFLLMLTFTLLYAGPLRGALERTWTDTIPRAFILAIVAHMTIQLAFTMAVHLRELAGPAPGSSRSPERSRSPGRSDARSDASAPPHTAGHTDALGLVITGIAIFLALLLGLQADRISHASMLGGEVAYRLFMGFYGLVFPAYVWLCMMPRRPWKSDADDVEPPHSRQWLLYVATLALAGPMFYMGYIQHQPLWLAPAMVLILLARAVPVHAKAA